MFIFPEGGCLRKIERLNCLHTLSYGYRDPCFHIPMPTPKTTPNPSDSFPNHSLTTPKPSPPPLLLTHPTDGSCGPEWLAILRLGGHTAADRVGRAKRWCDGNSSCSGFALDTRGLPPDTLVFRSRNLTRAAVPNPAWSVFWKGGPQPLPPPHTPPAGKP